MEAFETLGVPPQISPNINRSAQGVLGTCTQRAPMAQQSLGSHRQNSPVLNLSVTPPGPRNTKISPKAETLKVNVPTGGGPGEDKGRLGMKP